MLNIEEESGDMDMDYFQSLLQSKLAGTGSYQEQMAAQQQS